MNSESPLEGRSFAARLQAMATDPRVQVLAVILAALALLMAAGGIHVQTGNINVQVGAGR
jgi:hypothetical protein